MDGIVFCSPSREGNHDCGPAVLGTSLPKSCGTFLASPCPEQAPLSGYCSSTLTIVSSAPTAAKARMRWR